MTGTIWRVESERLHRDRPSVIIINLVFTQDFACNQIYAPTRAENMAAPPRLCKHTRGFWSHRRRVIIHHLRLFAVRSYLNNTDLHVRAHTHTQVQMKIYNTSEECTFIPHTPVQGNRFSFLKNSFLEFLVSFFSITKEPWYLFTLRLYYAPVMFRALKDEASCHFFFFLALSYTCV